MQSPILLIVGAGGQQKLTHYRHIAARGYRIVVCLDKARTRIPTDWATWVVDIPGLDEHLTDAETAIRCIDGLPCIVNGVLTLWEDCAPLTALISELLHLPGNLSKGSSIAKSKAHTAQALWNHGLAPRVWMCPDETALEQAFNECEPPALLKLEYGSSAAAVSRVEDREALLTTWRAIRAMLSKETDCPGIGLGFGNNLVLSELCIGPEFDVDLVRYQGKTVAEFVTLNSPTIGDSLAEIGAVMPAPIDESTGALLCKAATQACDIIGLTTGPINVELILTEDGPRVIDVNGRMGGFYIRAWINEIWGYDLLDAAIDCALGREPPRAIGEMGKGAIVGMMLRPSEESAWRGRTDGLEIDSIQFEENLEPHAFVNEPWSNVYVHGATTGQAAKQLLDELGRVGIELDAELVTWFNNLQAVSCEESSETRN
ncbi:MAG: ATP-grasp domain-containing protein [Nocardioides sp.]